MFRTKALALGLTFLTLFASASSAFAVATRGVKFKQDTTALTAPATLAYSLDLTTLLSDLGSGHYTWSTSGDKPSWLTLDNANSKLTGTAPLSEAGIPHTFRLGVQDGETGGLAQLTLTVIIVPIWAHDPIQLPVVKEGAALTFDLNSAITVPGGGAVSFSAIQGTLPTWMSVASNGKVTGTPPWTAAHANVGTFGGVIFVASTPSGGSSQTHAVGEVQKSAKGPKWTGNPIVIDDAHEDFAYAKDVSGTGFVTNFEQAALTFSIVSGPTWLQITPAGGLFGTPGKNDVATADKVTTRVSSVIDGVKFTDDAVLTLNVIHTPHSPTWTTNNITLPDAPTKLFYTQDLNAFVTNPDGGALVFQIVPNSGPSWATVTASGVLSGTPTRDFVGPNSWQVQVTSGIFAPVATINVKVVKRPPVWLTSPVLLANGKGNVAFSQSVASFAKDPDGDALTFSLVSGPSWAQVSAAGLITGTPGKTDSGPTIVRVAVSDGINAPVPNNISFTVDKADEPPTINQDQLTFTVKERSTFTVALNKAQYVSDPQGLPLTFTPIDTATWMTLGTDGTLTLKPIFKNIGTYAFKFSVTNSKLTSQGTLNIVVVRDPRVPVWAQNPIAFGAKATVPFSASIAAMAQDLDGLSLTFTKKSGPTWLTIDAQGNLSGKPPNSDVGENPFVITASNDLLGADTNVIISVINQPPVIHQDELAFIVKERATVTVGLNQAQYVQDPQGLPLTFTLVDTATYASLGADGKLILNPIFKDIGVHTLKFTVNNTKMTSAGTLTITVVRDPRAPVWSENPIRFSATTNAAFTAAVTAKAQDLDGLPLTFKKTSGPAWLTVDATGNLSGTPKTTDAGDNTFVVTASNDKLGADTTVIITVSNLPPVVHNDKLNFTVKERQVFTVSLNQAQYVQDPQGLPLTFTLVDSAGWVSLAADGTLTLKPLFKNIGSASFKFTTSNGQATTPGTLNVTVVRDPRAPVWSQNPIPFNAKAKVPFTASVGSFASDLDGLAITFIKKSGPSWLSVDATGALSGTPLNKEVGTETFVVTVRNDLMGADTTVLITVDSNFVPPVIHNENLNFTVKERATFTVGLNQAQYVTDPDGLPLTFALVDNKDWATLAADGTLALRPKFKDIGTYALKFTANNTKLSTNGTLNIVVVRDPRAPVWSQNPIQFGAKAMIPFTASLGALAQDLDGLSLTFAKKSGPTWLSVDLQGNLTGTPKNTDLGDNTFVVTVSNDLLGAEATVVVSVGIQPPVIHQDQLAFIVKERATFTVGLNQAQYVSDPQGLPLTFALLDVASYAKLGPDGTLTLTPLFGDIGVHSLKFTVNNTKVTSTGTMTVTVVRDPRAPVWSENSIRFTANSNAAFTASIATKVQDLDGLPLTFVKKSGPAWLTVDAAGNLKGTPKPADMGDNTFVVTASNDKLGADTTVIITVSNLPPVVHNDKLNFTVKERQVFTVALNQAQYVQDPQGLPLTFTLVDVADWVSLAADGTLTLKPLFKNIGTASFKFTASNGQQTTPGTLNVTVVRDPRAPVWSQNPITFNAKAKVPFTASVASFASDLDGLAITFSKKSGPSWLSVDASGGLSGTPLNADVGTGTFLVTVKNDSLGADTTVLIKVDANNVPPVIHQENLNFTVKERQVFTVGLNQAQYATDPDGLPLSFTLVDAKDWVVLATDGKLALRPQFKDIGVYALNFTVSNGKLSAPGILNITVLRDPRPPVWSVATLNFSATVQIPFTATIADKVKDQDGLPLTFVKKSGPTWLTVSSSGTLSGTPADSDVGANTFVVTASNDKLGADGNVIITVSPAHKLPVWSQDPIQLPNATATKAYAQSIATFAKSPDGDALMFSKLSGPAWAFVTASGLVIGTPLVADLGTNAFKVRVTDSHQASADVTVVVQVVPGKPPRWLQDPINLGNAPIEQFFQFNLASYAKDDDGNPLHFKLVIGPAWLVVSDIGLVTGTPHSANLGDYTAIFEVTNGMATAQAGGYGKVFDDSAPPIIVGKALVFSVKERETLLANLNSPQYVTEPHGLTMTFQILETADFVNLTTVGALTLKPIHKDLGEHTYTLKVTNSKNQSSQAPMLVHVLENPHPAPAWLADPIRMEAKVNTPFNNTLSDKAKSPDGLALTFSKKSGPTWLTVAAGGALSGTPLRADIGDNAFTVAVTDGAQSADATLIVTVKSETPTNDQIQVDQAVPGAASENLWVVDNSWYQHFGHNTQMDALAANLHYYYEALDAAQIHHTGVFISSDPKDFKGLPIKAGDSTPLMKWDDANLLHRFFVKMDATFNRYGCNSPLWSMFQLYKQAPGLSEIFHNGFWTADVPMDALIVTIHGDAYRSYSSHSQQANFKPDDYAKNFIDFANAQQQSYRISAVAPHCVVAEEPPPLEGGETKPRTREDVPIVEGQGNGENPYRVLVNRTRGTYYVWDSCNTNMRKVLQDYAQKVIFRAYVTAKHRIKLSKTPVDVKAITLTIGNNAIAGNTGAASDKWYYDAATNEVVVRWNLFDMSTIKAGDMIVISYKY